MRILQVSASDVGGGAERVAADLHRAYLARELDAWLAVGAKTGSLERTLLIPGPPVAASGSLAARMRVRAARSATDPDYIHDQLLGLEDMSFPGTRELLDLAPQVPDVLHLHNLHGGYFDLRELPRLSAALPTALTLHDTWLLTGHCAYALCCERWLTGCGKCPDITRPMAIPRDSSAANWRRKRDIYRRSRVHVAGPSRWVLAEAERSILSDAIVGSYLIPNGIDLGVFTPGDRSAARASLGLPQDAFIAVFSAAHADTSPFKDYATIARALPAVADALPNRDVRFVALGASGESHDPRIVNVPFLTAPAAVVRYLRAADLALHMAHGETFGLSIVEAQACGLPVVASAVGGIPETIVDGETGVLVPEGDDVVLADTVASLARDDARRMRMGVAASLHAKAHFGLERMVDGYLAMYATMLEDAEKPLPAR
ncbi:MAG: group 1 glycosyl transferase [Actinobacteria bacterium HGW-Actinobacteria-1]|jgi:glycosyltransferase involved in cell wall biosynthesis|nr:MAG: group 1 glycosyl transferase [Actinobacteria bacterium HGW-Actinobacteria-1]